MEFVTISVPTQFGNVEVKFELLKVLENGFHILYAQDRLVIGRQMFATSGQGMIWQLSDSYDLLDVNDDHFFDSEKIVFKK